MDVEVTLYGPPREAVGNKKTTLSLSDGATIEDVLDALTNHAADLEPLLLTETGELASGIVVLVNRINVSQRDGLRTRIDPEDDVIITPPIHGG